MKIRLNGFYADTYVHIFNLCIRSNLYVCGFLRAYYLRGFVEFVAWSKSSGSCQEPGDFDKFRTKISKFLSIGDQFFLKLSKVIILTKTKIFGSARLLLICRKLLTVIFTVFGVFGTFGAARGQYRSAVGAACRRLAPTHAHKPHAGVRFLAGLRPAAWSEISGSFPDRIYFLFFSALFCVTRFLHFFFFLQKGRKPVG